MEGKYSKWSSVLVVVALVSVLVSMGIPNAKAEWLSNATMSSSPSSAYREESTEFRFTLYNDQFKRLDVSKFWVEACWLPSGTGWDLGSASIPAYGDHTFKLYAEVPADASLGWCDIEKRVTGKADGDWWSTTGTWNKNIWIDKRDPLNVITSGNPTSGDKPLMVYFSTSVSGGTPGYDYSWTFGDGGSSSSKNPSHTYTSTGTYSAKVIVTDDLGRTDSDTVSITVKNPPPTSGGDTNGNTQQGEGDIGGLTDSSSVSLLALLGIIVLVVVLAVIMMMRRKRDVVSPQPQQVVPVAGIISCRFCGGDIDPSSDYCGHCGKGLKVN